MSDDVFFGNNDASRPSMNKIFVALDSPSKGRLESVLVAL